MYQLLLIDDDSELCAMLAEYLATEDFKVDMAHDGHSGLQLAQVNHYDTIILDVMMPGMNGLDVLRELRKTHQTPVLMLTARGDDIDSIVGLELGADDYLAKPCNPRVLVARIRAVLRRLHPPQGDNTNATQVLIIGALKLEPGTRRAFFNNKDLILTSTEFSILEVLARQAGQIVTKDTLSEQALGRSLSRYDRSIDMHVSSLRKKIATLMTTPAQATTPRIETSSPIQTIRGSGYQYILDQRENNHHA